jgi:hypothetical protein
MAIIMKLVVSSDVEIALLGEAMSRPRRGSHGWADSLFRQSAGTVMRSGSGLGF